MLIENCLAALLWLLLISFAIIGYSLLLKKEFNKFSISWPLALPLGLGTMSSLALLFGLAKAYHWVGQSLIFLVGVISFLQNYKSIKYSKLFKSSDYFWLLIPGLYFFTRMFSCFLPQQHSDALYYHLAAPKFWALIHQVKLVAEHPSFAQSTLIELIYGWPLLLLPISSTASLITTQIFAQLMHLVWGHVLTTFLVFFVLKKLTHNHRQGLLFFAAWLISTQPAFEWLSCLAKNDYFITVYIIAALLSVLDKKYFIAGILAGLSFSTKILAAWAVLALFTLIDYKYWLRYLAGVALASALFLARNLLSTLNPLFPNLDDKIGPHWVSTGWRNHNLSFGGGIQFDWKMMHWLDHQMFHKPLAKILMVLGLACLGYELTRQYRQKLRPGLAGLPLQRWLMFLGLQFTLCVLMLRPLADGRYGNFIAIFILIFLMAYWFEVFHQLKNRYKYFQFIIFPLFLLINIPVDSIYKISKNYLLTNAEHYLEQFHPLYSMHRWVKNHVNDQEKIFFSAEKIQYYLDRDYQNVVEMKKWEDLLLNIQTEKELFQMLKEQGYDYVHFSPQTGGFPAVLRRYWSAILAAQSKAVYRDGTSLIFDLHQQNF